jgi:hypothetical protein
MTRLIWLTALVVLLAPAASGASQLRRTSGAADLTSIDATRGPQNRPGQVVALDPEPSSVVIRSNEVALDGGASSDHSPTILAATYTHDDTRLTVHATGSGLASAVAARLGAADGAWTFPLSLVQHNDTSLTATGTTIAAVPSCVLRVLLQRGRTLQAPLPGESVTLPPAPLYIPDMLDPDPMFYPKDFALVCTPGKLHCIYIRHNTWPHLPDSLDERAFGHRWTSDWVTWSQDPAPSDTTVLTTRDGTWDDSHVWSPSIVQQGLAFYMFYTGVHDDPETGFRVQQIGLARSFDLSHWTRNGPPVFTVGAVPWADHSTTRELQFRDPFVMRDPTRPTGWVLYYVTTLADRVPQMVVGVARSVTDTLGGGWSNLGRPLLVTDNAHTYGSNKTEAPQVFWDRGRWQMLFTTGAGHPISIALNARAPVDTLAADSLNWDSARFFYYLSDSARDEVSIWFVDSWSATEHLAVGGQEFLGAYDGTGVCIREMHWLSTTPPYFGLASPPVASGPDDGASASTRGPALSFAGASPARGEARLGVAVGRGEDVRVAIFDAAGRRIKVLLDGRMPADRTVVTWDGRDADGRRVAAGVYFAGLWCRQGTRSLRVALLW